MERDHGTPAPPDPTKEPKPEGDPGNPGDPRREPTPWHDPGPPVRKINLPPDSPSPGIPLPSGQPPKPEQPLIS